MTNEVIYKIVVAVTTCIVAIAAAVCLPSCKAVRSYAVDCSCVHVADSVHIHAVTTESYVGRKNP